MYSIFEICVLLACGVNCYIEANRVLKNANACSKVFLIRKRIEWNNVSLIFFFPTRIDENTTNLTRMKKCVLKLDVIMLCEIGPFTIKKKNVRVYIFFANAFNA